MKIIFRLCLILLLVLVIFQNILAYLSLIDRDVVLHGTYADWLPLPIFSAVESISQMAVNSYTALMEFLTPESLFDDYKEFYESYIKWAFDIIKSIAFVVAPILALWAFIYTLLLIFSRKAAISFKRRSRYAIVYGVWSSPLVSPIIDIISGIFLMFSTLVSSGANLFRSFAVAMEHLLSIPANKLILWSSNLRIAFDDTLGDKILEADKKWDEIEQKKHIARMKVIQNRKRRRRERSAMFDDEID